MLCSQRRTSHIILETFSFFFFHGAKLNVVTMEEKKRFQLAQHTMQTM